MCDSLTVRTLGWAPTRPSYVYGCFSVGASGSVDRMNSPSASSVSCNSLMP